MTPTKQWENFCKKSHQNVNQFYGKGNSHPYSFHLDLVNSVSNMYLNDTILGGSYSSKVVEWAIWGHDLIEDCRFTYNDIVKNISALKPIGTSPLDKKRNEQFSIDVAECIFLCTDYRGRNRDERKPPLFWEELSANKLAIAVKMCDTLANMRYGYITNSSMLKAYTKNVSFYKKFVNDHFVELIGITNEMEYIIGDRK